MEKKPRARKQAQVEEFAHSRLKEFSPEQQLFLRFSDELSRNVIKDPEHIPEEYPDELKHAIYNYWEAYVQFLRSLKEEDKLALRLAEQNATVYEEKFSGPVQRLKSRLKRQGERSNGFVGKGSNGAAYALELDGKEYVVKFGTRADQTNFDIRALIRTKGVPHVAQIVAYSFEDKATVMERMPGKDVTQSSEQELSLMSDQQMVQLIQAVKELVRRGLVIDPKAANFMYDPKAGFGVLDYHVAHGSSARMVEQVMSLRLMLTTKEDHFQWPRWDDPEYQTKVKKQSVEHQRFYLPRLIRFVIVLKEQFPEMIDQWKWVRKQQLEKVPHNGWQFLRKDEFIMDNPGIAGYVAQLEELDDGWIFI